MKRIVIVLAGIVMLVATVVVMAFRLERDSSAPSSSPAPNATEAPPTTPQLPGDATRITLADFLALHADKRVLVIDVRMEGAFREGHIPGAINMGPEAVADHLPGLLALADGRPIVTYCSCVNEHSSAVAAVRLTEAGAPDVRALVGGYQAWVAQGGPVAKGDGSGE